MIRSPTCPICDKELPPEAITGSAVFPFCSKRCKQIDLYRWTQGEYAIVEELTPERLFERLAEDEPEGGEPFDE